MRGNRIRGIPACRQAGAYIRRFALYSTMNANAFFKEAQQELKKVNWPTRKETVRLTAFVIVLSLAVAAFLGALDIIFLKILELFII